MKELLTEMFNGWLIRNASWDKSTGEFAKDEINAMAEACGGDRMKGELLVLFGHWGDDIITVAAHYGIAIKDDRVVDIEAPPTSQHWWDQDAFMWREPFKDEDVVRS